MSLFELPSLEFQPSRYRYRGIGDWSGHAPFARDLIAALRPRLFVELGTHYGESYFVFCQSIREEGCDTNAFAIDTWLGDAHTGGYGDEVFQDVDEHNSARYAGFSTLLRMPFGQALSRFQDRTIDLLHIDGLHDYESVRNDFQSWLPKMSPGGIILLHDIGVRRADFGVWRLWEELRGQYRTFEFAHSAGLGVVQVPGDREPRGILELLFQPADGRQEGIRRYYEMCAERLDYRFTRDREREWDIVTQLFWRSVDEEFAENRSSRSAITLTGRPSTIRLTLSPTTNPCELRLDLTNRKMALRVFQVSFQNALGDVLSRQTGGEFFRGKQHSDFWEVPQGQQSSLVITVGDSCSVIVPLSAACSGIESARSVSIELSAVPLETAVQELAAHVQAEMDSALMQARELLSQHSREIGLLTEGLARAEALVAERDRSLKSYDEALRKAQEAAADRLVEIERIKKSLTWKLGAPLRMLGSRSGSQRS